MRLKAAEKQEIIWMVERSDLGVNQTLDQLGIPKSTFYKWYKAYTERVPLVWSPKHRKTGVSGT